MGLYDFAKCSLLENMVATIGLPLWQTGVVVLSIVFGQVAGTLVGFRIGKRRLPLDALRTITLATAALMATALIIIVVSGLQYVLFLLRMVKDGFYCTYFGASNELSKDQVVALVIAVVGNVIIAAWAAIDQRSPSRLGYRIGSALSCGACVIAGGFPLVAGMTIFNAVLIGLAWRALRAGRTF